MKKWTTICDHCGKEMDLMIDYEAVEFDTEDEFLQVDLCSECYKEISSIIKQFCGRVG